MLDEIRGSSSMYRTPESDWSRISDVGYGPEYELTFLPPPSAANSRERGDNDKIKLLDNTETSYSSAYAPDNHVLGSASIQRFRELRLRGRNLGKYFRLDDPKDAGTPFRGWRKAVFAAAIVTGVVLTINFILMMIARFRFDAEDGVGLIYKGDCGTVKRWDTSLHLAINLLGTALLAASSFTMQCLCSPSRSEVDAAHAKCVTLEIGLQSTKNLFHVAWWKGTLWVCLCLSTLPLHLLWNSTIFSTTSANLFSFVVAEESFLNGASYSEPAKNYPCSGYENGTQDLTSIITQIHDGYKENRYTNMSAANCFDSYSSGYLSTRRNLIILVETPTTPVNMSYCGYQQAKWDGSSVLGVGLNQVVGVAWMADITGEHPKAIKTQHFQDQIKSTGTWEIGEFKVKSCLAETQGLPQPGCELQFVSYILYVVVACNIVKFICMCMAARYLWNINEPILATVGDAVSSFLDNPDQTTKGLCLLDLPQLRAGVWENENVISISRHNVSISRYNASYDRKPLRRLYRATTTTRWWWSMILCVLYLITGFVLWSVSLENLSGYTFDESMKLRFGAVDAQLVLGYTAISGGAIITDIVIANSFQLALSTTYFLYNSLYTAQCAALEWASYIQGKRKSLRVTWPRGQQRSTYYLQLPYRYGIPLTIVLILMHFLISQSIFLARLQMYDSDGDPVPSGRHYNVSDVGFSPRANLTTCLVGVVMILAQVVMALRPLDNRIPSHGNKSVVISAMCHPNPEDADMKLRRYSSTTSQGNKDSISTKPLMWGVTREPLNEIVAKSLSEQFQDEGAGHCAFTADVVALPEVGKQYR